MSMGSRPDPRGVLHAYRSRRHLGDALLGRKRNPGPSVRASTHLIARFSPGVRTSFSRPAIVPVRMGG